MWKRLNAYFIYMLCSWKSMIWAKLSFWSIYNVKLGQIIKKKIRTNDSNHGFHTGNQVKKLSLGSEGNSSCYNINKTIPCVYRAPHNRRFIPLSGGDSPFRYSDCTCPTSGWEQTWSCCHLVLEFGSVLS